MNNLKHENIFLKGKLPAFKRHLAFVILQTLTQPQVPVACICGFDFQGQDLGKALFRVPLE